MPIKEQIRTERLEIFYKLLNRFTKFSDIHFLAERLLQKLPESQEVIERLISENAVKDRPGAIREYIMDVVNQAARPESTLDLPTKLVNYVAYTDIHYKLLHMSSYNWHTFVLLDYNAEIHNASFQFPENSFEEPQNLPAKPVAIKDIYCKVKKYLKKSENFGLVSVQNEIDFRVFNDSVTTVILRIATLPIYKKLDEEAQQTKLMSKSPNFYVYVPGEPYFYASTSQPNEEECNSIIKALKCTGYSAVPLIGKNLDSLRQLRLARDRARVGKNASFVTPLNEPVVKNTANTLPKLQSFQIHCSSKFETAELENEDAEIPKTGNNAFEFTVTFKGPDVLQGFEDMCNQGIFEKPYPNWMTNAPHRGRNSISVKKIEAQTVDDAASIAATDITAI